MKIGFIDHHLKNFHSGKFLELLRGSVGGGEVEVCAAYESHPQAGEDWCAAHGVARASSVAEVIAQSDAVIVLAPDVFEAHLTLAQPCLEAGKPTFVDKALAHTLGDARELVRLSERHRAPLMSSSSLRFAVELEDLLSRFAPPYSAIFTRGLGKWRGYGVHTIAPALRLMGAPIRRVIDTGSPGSRIVTLDDGERRALVEVRQAANQYEACPWQFGVLKDDRYATATVGDFDGFYANLMREVLKFFRTGETPIGVEEQLQTVAVEIAAEVSLANGGQWAAVET